MKSMRTGGLDKQYFKTVCDVSVQYIAKVYKSMNTSKHTFMIISPKRQL